MKPDTVLIVRAAFGFETCEELTNLLRLPVTAFYRADDVSSGEGLSSVPREEAEGVAATLDDLSNLVSMRQAPDVTTEEELRAWAAGQIARIRAWLDSAAEQLKQANLGQLVDTAKELRTAAQSYAGGLVAFDAAQPSELIDCAKLNSSRG